MSGLALLGVWWKFPSPSPQGSPDQTLSFIVRLISDREITLYDGSQLLCSDRYDLLKEKFGLCDEQLTEK